MKTPFEMCEEIVALANQLTNHVRREITIRPYTFEGREMRVITYKIVEGILSLDVIIERLEGHTCAVRMNEKALPLLFDGFVEECMVFAIAYLRGVLFTVHASDRSRTCLESLRGVLPDSRYVSDMYVVSSLLRRINRLAVWPEDVASALLIYHNKIPDTFVTVDLCHNKTDGEHHVLRVCREGHAYQTVTVYPAGQITSGSPPFTRRETTFYPQSVLVR